MDIIVVEDKLEMGELAGKRAGELIWNAIDERGQANVILATGTSQFETLRQLVSETGIDWSKVVVFHLDEYIGLPDTHPASFRKYLRERFISKVGKLKAAHLIDGQEEPAKECKRLNDLIKSHPIDVALVGIGENGHLAFNDPPADFITEQPYITVALDDLCIKQQYGEGWFKSIAEVPRKAISMSIRQIMKSSAIICSVPDGRKAEAVKNCLEQSVSNIFPASILQDHAHCTIYLDTASASMLTSTLRA
ncbi:MAG TPA: glucosamine-6-phosphate deaminase [Chryseolinea sp.]|nr:glucosamine-6-phosphate deaminase [Chryseolinea sp.]